ncbi:Thymidylate kinase [Acholeplasma oculi]|uniref:Thymidylate kinase n=1 Tax=Acholeplasma oculi TaxID=35623 RepID=A0A061AD91_9MOLU|nr:dTMP kinase [Acholeplasma oculi]CDR31399.1 Thymidylate kinase [Acholeplasma oculi]SKC39704.1 dTMP kinase [Acholeplasma oculi]SUT91902.1 Thymidylate kinase [Acholeplasma oculi]
MLITFEGGEGSGKTTLIEKLKKELLLLGKEVVTTREPGGSVIAEKIRNILLDNNNQSIKPHTEALLFAASRAQHLDEVIIPNLDKIILCDRYIDSSFAYQAFGRDLGLEFVKSVNQYALSYMPDMTFYIDLDPQVGMARVHQNRGHKTDRLDLETKTFHEKVRSGYLELSKIYANRFIVIEGNRTIDEIYQHILGEILKRI